MDGQTGAGPRAWPLAREAEFLRLLWEIDHKLEVQSKLLQARTELTSQQYSVLRLVGRFPGISAGQLAELLHVHPGVLTVLIRGLVSRRCVERMADSRDQRRVRLVLTARGRELDVPRACSAESSIGRMMSLVRLDDLEGAQRVLTTLAAVLGKDVEGDRDAVPDGGAGSERGGAARAPRRPRRVRL